MSLTRALTAPANTMPFGMMRQAAFRWAYGLLCSGYFLFSLVGLHPFQDGSLAERAEGSPLDRFFVFALFGLALVVLALRPEAALARLRQNAAAASIIAFAFASMAWSDYPDLTLRRALLLALLAVAALAVAAGVGTMRRFHTMVFLALTATVIVNLLAIAAFPGLTLTDIGAKGIYTQKNVTGLVAMLAFIVSASWALGAAPGRLRWAGRAAAGLAFGLLLLSRSKTSIALALLALAVGAIGAFARRAGPRFVAGLTGLALLALAGVVIVALAVDLDAKSLLALLPVDASLSGRDELWAYAVRRASERPWLGYGYGAFWDVGVGHDPLSRLEPGTWLGDVEPGIINQAHNGYLELWLEIGAPATALTVLAFLQGTLASARSAFTARGAEIRAAYAAIALTLFVYLLHNLTEATLFARGGQFFNVALLMLLLARRDGREDT